MTELVHASPNRAFESSLMAGMLRYGALSDGWIAEDGISYLADHAGEDHNGNSLTFPLGDFSFTTANLTVTVEGGEAFVDGGWLASDQTYGVDLAPSTAGQTVYLGWDRYSPNNVIVGLASAFEVADEPDNPRLALGTFDTDTTSIIASTDHRTDYLGPSQSFVNRMYDADADGTIDNALRVGGIASASLMRKDQNQTMSGHLTFGNGFNVTAGGATFGTTATFNAAVNFSKNEAQGFRIENRTSRPSNPAIGQLIYRTDRD